MGKIMLAKRRTNQIDNNIGLRIRLRRMQLKISQPDLAKKLGISFQQVQKYEKGTNRVAAARLQRIAEVLEVPITFFIKSAEGFARKNPDTLDFLRNAYAYRLVNAFSNIRDKQIQLSVLTLVEQIAARN
jgi:transcriptional regulator with XRE-family HTH domain